MKDLASFHLHTAQKTNLWNLIGQSLIASAASELSTSYQCKIHRGNTQAPLPL